MVAKADSQAACRLATTAGGGLRVLTGCILAEGQLFFQFLGMVA